MCSQKEAVLRRTLPSEEILGPKSQLWRQCHLPHPESIDEDVELRAGSPRLYRRCFSFGNITSVSKNLFQDLPKKSTTDNQEPSKSAQDTVAFPWRKA